MKHVVGWATSAASWIAVALGLYFSFHYLPPIGEMPPFQPGRQEQNWIGQGGWAFAGYSFLLLAVAYCAKRVILVNCTRRWAAVYFFSSLIMLSLPYVWFLCEPDWFNSFIYRVSCWVGGPIAIWFVPTLSFLTDLCYWGTAKPLKRYLIRSGIEAMVVFPVWAVFWAFFSFFVLDWGWI